MQCKGWFPTGKFENLRVAVAEAHENHVSAQFYFSRTLAKLQLESLPVFLGHLSSSNSLLWPTFQFMCQVNELFFELLQMGA
jgi:hypothetical protein